MDVILAFIATLIILGEVDAWLVRRARKPVRTHWTWTSGGML